jgi:hypothetical protein
MKNDEKRSKRRGSARDKTVGSAVAAAPLPESTWNAGSLIRCVSAETSDGKTKYGKCLIKLPIRKMGDMSMFVTSADILNGFPCNIIYAFGLKVGPLGLSTEPHIHDHDEVVYFIGSNPKDIGTLGAEVNFKIGPKGQEENHIISAATAVVIPKGVWHCPMETLKFEKPFLCMAVSLTAKYEFHYAGKKKTPQ